VQEATLHTSLIHDTFILLSVKKAFTQFVFTAQPIHLVEKNRVCMTIRRNIEMRLLQLPIFFIRFPGLGNIAYTLA